METKFLVIFYKKPTGDSLDDWEKIDIHAASHDATLRLMYKLIRIWHQHQTQPTNYQLYKHQATKNHVNIKQIRTCDLYFTTIITT